MPSINKNNFNALLIPITYYLLPLPIPSLSDNQKDFFF